MSYSIERQNGGAYADGTPSYTYFATYRTWLEVSTELERVNSLLWRGRELRITDNRTLTEICIQGHAIDADSPRALPVVGANAPESLPWVACK